jgi:hypothetical protein
MSHVGFTGTQRGMEPNQLSVVRYFLGGLAYTRLHHGDCIGADAQAHQIARRKGLSIHRHPPDNPSKRAFCDFDYDSPELPYLVRNQAIVDFAEFMIAAPGEFEEQLRSGTWATIRYARKTKTPLVIVYPDGSH